MTKRNKLYQFSKPKNWNRLCKICGKDPYPNYNACLGQCHELYLKGQADVEQHYGKVCDGVIGNISYKTS